VSAAENGPGQRAASARWDAEYAEGYAAAKGEVCADGWTLDTARAYLASVGPATTAYGQGFDHFLSQWVDGSLSPVLLSRIG
jgi:hypothetical protein